MASFEEELAELQADLQGLLIYTEDEILDEGLRDRSLGSLLKSKETRRRPTLKDSGLTCVPAQIWVDLQTPQQLPIMLVANERSLKNFFAARSSNDKKNVEAKRNETYILVPKHGWWLVHVECIAALKAAKIT